MAKADSGAEALDGLVRFYRKHLLETDYRAGCPVLAVAVEAGEPDTGPRRCSTAPPPTSTAGTT